MKWLVWMVAQATLAFAAVFQHSGRVHLTRGSMIVTASFKVQPFASHCHEVLNHIENLPLAARSAEGHIKDHLRFIIGGVCAQVKSWPTLAREADRRGKRSLIALAGAVFGGVAVELWHSLSGTSTRELEKRLAREGERLRLLAATVLKIQNHVERLEEDTIRLQALVELTLVATQFERAIDQVGRGLSQLAAARRVTADLLPAEALEGVWKEVQLKMRRMRLPKIKLPKEVLYECEATLVYERDNIDIVIELPIVESTFTLYHKTSHPTWLPGRKSPVIIGGEAFLAVSKGDRAFVVPRKEMGGCTTLAGEKLCPLEVARSDWQEHCLGALYKGLWEEALAICPLEAFRDHWSAERLSHDTFDLVLKETTPYRLICEEEKHGRIDVWPKGNSTVVLPPGCFATSAKFTLHAAVENGIRVAVRPATGWLAPTTVQAALKKRLVAVREEEEEESATVRSIVVEEQEEEEASSGLRVPAVGAAIAAALAVGVFGAWWRRRRRLRKNQPRQETQRPGNNSVEIPVRMDDS
jgi:hypothetical protein